jgi:hypothetical protein
MTRINLSKSSEFDIQAAAYYRLVYKFKHVKGEVKVPNPEGGRGARLDIVICDDEGNIVIAFEVKKSQNAKEKSIQLKNYRQMFDFPVVLIAGWDDAKNVVDIALRHLMPIDSKLLKPKGSKWM